MVYFPLSPTRQQAWSGSPSAVDINKRLAETTYFVHTSYIVPNPRCRYPPMLVLVGIGIGIGIVHCTIPTYMLVISKVPFSPSPASLLGPSSLSPTYRVVIVTLGPPPFLPPLIISLPETTDPIRHWGIEGGKKQATLKLRLHALYSWDVSAKRATGRPFRASSAVSSRYHIISSSSTSSLDLILDLTDALGSSGIGHT